MVKFRVFAVVSALVAPIALGFPCQAVIIHRDIEDKLIAVFGGQLDIDGDGNQDFHLFTGSVLDSSGLVINGKVEENAIYKFNSSVFAEPITLDTTIGVEGQTFFQTAPLNVESCSPGSGCTFASPFINASSSEEFIGIQFLIDGMTHNGIVGFTMFINSGSILVQEYYYESEPDMLLVVPSPGLLAFLPMSAIGLRRQCREL